MVNFTVDAKRFEILKEHVSTKNEKFAEATSVECSITGLQIISQRIRNLLNREMDQPYNIALYHLSVLLTDHVWRREDLLEAISSQ